MQRKEEVKATPQGVVVRGSAQSKGQSSGIDQPAKPPVLWMIVPVLLIALAIYFAR
ncbi:MAG: hypothetical protein ABW133_04570 [Polyangiaceae bacterium]